MRWVIGDVHGMRDPLEALVAAIDGVDPSRQLFFTGDFVNRGPDSSGVIELLLHLPDVQCVRGNHDDVVDLILSAGAEASPAPRVVDEAIAALRWFVRYGLDRTLEGYGLDALWITEAVLRPTRARLREIHEAVPAAHRAFLAGLPMALEHPHFFVIHGRWDPLLPTFDPPPSRRVRSTPTLRQDMLWGRFSGDEIDSPKQWNRRGFFGHTPVYEYLMHASPTTNRPVVGRGMTLVDTGCAMVPFGRLSAVCMDDDRVIQADRDGRILSA